MIKARPAADTTLVVYNPGARRGARRLRRVRHWLETRRIEARFTPIGDLERALSVDDQRAEMPTRVVAVGGDGTVSAIAGWLHRRDLELPIGIVPAGTGNNLAAGIRLPRGFDASVETAFLGTHTRAIDGIHFDSGSERLVMVQTAALGFPAEVAVRYDEFRRSPLRRIAAVPVGTQIYRILALAHLRRLTRRQRNGEAALRVKITLPDEQMTEDVLALCIGNERSTGGGFAPCPRAVVDDGLLDLCLIRDGGERLKLLNAVGRGTHLAHTERVLYRQTPGPVSIELPHPVPVAVDGDVAFEADHLELTLLPRRFPVFVG